MSNVVARGIEQAQEAPPAADAEPLEHTAAGETAAAEEPAKPPAPPGTTPLGFDPRTLEDQALYLVLLDRFHDADQEAFAARDPADPLAYHGGDLRGLYEKLPYLADLGVTAIWLTPLPPQVPKPVGPEGKRHFAFHGYWPERHTHIEHHFGDEEDLRAVVERAHELGLRVVLDVVTNHFGYGAKGAYNPAWVRSNELGTCPDDGNERTQCLFGLPDLKTEKESVRKLVVRWTSGWFTRFGIDGLRFDAAKHVDPELLWEIHDRGERAVRERALPAESDTSFFTIAEHWGAAPGDENVRAYVDSGAADTLFDFSFSGLVEGFLTGRMRAEALAHHLEQWHAAEGPPLVHSLDTHDTSTFVHRLGDDSERYPLAAFLQMSVRGIPLVTWGDELARGGGEWPLNRADMPWSKLESTEGKRLHGLWRELLRLRRSAPSLRSRDYVTTLAVTDDESATLAFRRGEDLLVVVHRGAAAERTLTGLPRDVDVKVCLAEGAWGRRRWTVDAKGELSISLPQDAAAVLTLASESCRAASSS